ncbi:MAG: very short patch repair endonuclease [Actinobacteria bacterium]|nr:very short patch repair endonuclease [Actinomycetota bacterium]
MATNETGSRTPRDPAVTSRMMARVRSKDSKAELALRRTLHARGFRYRLHGKDILGRPDIVNRSRRLAIFVDGDMWHGNEHRRRGLASLAELFPTRTEWWVEKIKANMRRDHEVTTKLREQGWTVIRLWESEVLADPDGAAQHVLDASQPDAVANPRAWKRSRPDPVAWRPAPGLVSAARATEQDRAAGGRAARQVQLQDGRRAVASVALRALPSSRRIYAYLRWYDHGKTHERYLGEVNESTRAANLMAAWSLVTSRRPGASHRTGGPGRS